MSQWKKYCDVQAVAKNTLGQLGSTITASDTEASIAQRAVALLAEQGIFETWYYNCPAFVLLGSRSCTSMSGREYVPNIELVGQTNLVTVDLSPCLGEVWGDCARSFFVEGGRSVNEPQRPEFRRGWECELMLHREMQVFVSTATTFEELHQFANELIVSAGFENLDFMGNLGHSIEVRLEDRIYIEVGSSSRLVEAGLFTFEPHIREVGGAWGFKFENIYYFGDKGRPIEL